MAKLFLLSLTLTTSILGCPRDLQSLEPFSFFLQTSQPLSTSFPSILCLNSKLVTWTLTYIEPGRPSLFMSLWTSVRTTLDSPEVRAQAVHSSRKFHQYWNLCEWCSPHPLALCSPQHKHLNARSQLRFLSLSFPSPLTFFLSSFLLSFSFFSMEPVNKMFTGHNMR